MSQTALSVPQVIAILEVHFALLGRQIQALRDGDCSVDVVLLVQYVALASLKRTSDWANEQGMAMPSAKGGTRRYAPKDIDALIKNPPAGTDSALMLLVRNVQQRGREGATFAFH